MKFKLIGDPERDGEIRAHIHFGYDFSNGAVEVTEAEIIEKLKGNSHFMEVKDAVKETAPASKASKPRKKAARKKTKLKVVDNANEDATVNEDTQENRGS